MSQTENCGHLKEVLIEYLFEYLFEFNISMINEENSVKNKFNIYDRNRILEL